jgi:hypothetical protein
MNRGWLFFSVLLASAGAVHADESFRCGKWIASSDMSIADLLAKCGEPTQRTSSTEDVLARNKYGLMQKTGETTVKIWTYDRGANAPPMVVTIVDGRIKSIERKK